MTSSRRGTGEKSLLPCTICKCLLAVALWMPLAVTCEATVPWAVLIELSGSRSFPPFLKSLLSFFLWFPLLTALYVIRTVGNHFFLILKYDFLFKIKIALFKMFIIAFRLFYWEVSQPVLLMVAPIHLNKCVFNVLPCALKGNIYFTQVAYLNIIIAYLY